MDEALASRPFMLLHQRKQFVQFFFGISDREIFPFSGDVRIDPMVRRQIPIMPALYLVLPLLVSFASRRSTLVKLLPHPVSRPDRRNTRRYRVRLFLFFGHPAPT